MKCNHYFRIFLVLVKLCNKMRSAKRSIPILQFIWEKKKIEIHTEIVPLLLSKGMYSVLNRKQDFRITKWILRCLFPACALENPYVSIYYFDREKNLLLYLLFICCYSPGPTVND